VVRLIRLECHHPNGLLLSSLLPQAVLSRGVNILTGEVVPGRALTGWVFQRTQAAPKLALHCTKHHLQRCKLQLVRYKH
jgi:hypothetical protein